MRADSRLEYCDLAKGIGIVGVLLAHAGIGLFWLHPYYMQMFFFVSGIVYSYKNKDNAREPSASFARSKKIAVRYFRWSYRLFIAYIPLFVLNHNDFYWLIRNFVGVFYARKCIWFPLGKADNIIFMEYGNAPMWFLPCFAVAWFFFAGICNIYAKSKRAAAALTIGCLVITVILQDIPVLLPWSIDTAFWGAIFNLFGTAFEIMVSRLKKREQALVVLLGAPVYYAAYRVIRPQFNMSVREYNFRSGTSAIIFLIFSLLGTIVFMVSCRFFQRLRIARPLEYCGKNTIVLLCCHPLIYQYCDYFYAGNKNATTYKFSKTAIVLILVLCGQAMYCKIKSERNRLHSMHER